MWVHNIYDCYMRLSWTTPQPLLESCLRSAGFWKGSSVFVFQYSGRQYVLEGIAIQEEALPASIGIGSVRYVCVCSVGLHEHIGEENEGWRWRDVKG